MCSSPSCLRKGEAAGRRLGARGPACRARGVQSCLEPWSVALRHLRAAPLCLFSAEAARGETPVCRVGVGGRLNGPQVVRGFCLGLPQQRAPSYPPSMPRAGASPTGAQSTGRSPEPVLPPAFASSACLQASTYCRTASGSTSSPCFGGRRRGSLLELW